MIIFNDPAHSKERAKQKPLNLEEQQETVDAINMLLDKMVWTGVLAEARREYYEDKLQAFINDYQNLDHYRATTGGLICTDKAEYLGKPDFFQLKFSVNEDLNKE